VNVRDIGVIVKDGEGADRCIARTLEVEDALVPLLWTDFAFS